MKTTPEQLPIVCSQYAKNGDTEGWMALFERNAVFADPEGQLKSGESLRQAVAEFAAMKPDLQMKVTKVIVADDIALVHTTWSMPGHDMSGYGVEVSRRQPDGSWRLVIDDPFTVPANK
jgi:ketosteroid isomerase-like protein